MRRLLGTCVIWLLSFLVFTAPSLLLAIGVIKD